MNNKKKRNIKYNYFGEKKEKHAEFVIDPFDQDYEVSILQILYRTFQLILLQDNNF